MIIKRFRQITEEETRQSHQFSSPLFLRDFCLQKKDPEATKAMVEILWSYEYIYITRNIHV